MRSLTTQDPSEALQFLKNHDHEGASINLIVEVDMDDCYTVLESLVKEK